jgi:hypothetical protein
VSDSSSGAEPRRFHPIPALLALAQGGWIWWLSSAPRHWGGSAPLWGFLGNSFHFVLFAVLTVLLAEAFRRGGGWSRDRLLVVLLIASGYAIVDELHQASIPERSADAGDVCVDFLGIVAALALWWGLRGPGRVAPAFGRAFAVGLAAAAFNAWRAWGGAIGGGGAR